MPAVPDWFAVLSHGLAVYHADEADVRIDVTYGGDGTEFIGLLEPVTIIGPLSTIETLNPIIGYADDTTAYIRP